MFDVLGLQREEWHVPVSADAQEALQAQGIDAPAEVVFYLEPANFREQNRVQLGLGQFKDPAFDKTAWACQLLMRRAAPGTLREVVWEVVQDMNEADLLYIASVYIAGRVVDPKQFGVQIQLWAGLNPTSETTTPTAAESEPLPSSLTSTA
ncbi:hypothetical protein DKM44_12810 [Deinococcus irradiatisoli]|uniref:Uncharacterized protein n=1 Tax=Deinococcus irradiatisoli TaxID=2202254 RepID=A0A2Z3JG49_9DEIO|nr:hypothetical protein [Deinococcus irradiatisoli]AWN24002.1 hypothetical protein DKM44_12810 [Deinococcus irradiatisoli]